MAGFFLFRGLHPQCVPRRFEGKDALLPELAQLGTFRQQCNMLKAVSFERQELSASCQFFYSLWNLPFCQATWPYHQRRLVVPLVGAWRASSLRGRVWLQLVKSRTLFRILKEKKHFAKHIAASTMRFLTSLEEITGKVWIYKSYETSSIYQILLTSRCMHYRLFSAWVKIGISSFSVASHVDNCFFRAAFQSSNRHQCSPLRGSLCLCQCGGLQKSSKLCLHKSFWLTVESVFTWISMNNPAKVHLQVKKLFNGIGYEIGRRPRKEN